jgi:hypothetical protein
VPDEVAGQLRLAAAASLLRLVRRHDARLGAGCYCMLALVMQDNQIGVRGVFAAKVYRLVNYFNVSATSIAEIGCLGCVLCCLFGWMHGHPCDHIWRCSR